MEQLSNREMEVADLIHQGKVTKEIADQLFISEHTAKTHSKNIRRKLGARNIADITRIFLLKLRPQNIAIIVIAIALSIIAYQHPEYLLILKTSIIDILK